MLKFKFYKLKEQTRVPKPNFGVDFRPNLEIWINAFVLPEYWSFCFLNGLFYGWEKVPSKF